MKIENLSALTDLQVESLANEKLDAGLNVDAISLYSELIRRRPVSAKNYARRGLAKYSMNDFEAAESDFSLAISIKPNAPNTIFMRARSRENLNRPLAALGDYLKVIKLNPEALDAYINASYIYEYMGLIDRAILTVADACKVHPDNVDLNLRMKALWGRRKVDDA